MLLAALLVLDLGGSAAEARASRLMEAPADTARILVSVDDRAAARTTAKTVADEVRALFAARRPVTVTTVGLDPSAVRTDRADAVVAIGPVAANRWCSAASAVPILALTDGSGVLAPVSVEAETAGDSPAPASCTFVGPTGWPTSTFRAFRSLLPAAPVDVVVPARVAQHLPSAPALVQQHADAAGVDARLVEARPSDTVSVGAEGRVVFLDYVDAWTTPERRAFTSALVRRGVPVLASRPESVEDGALAAPDLSTTHRARRVALHLESQLLTSATGAESNPDAAPHPVSEMEPADDAAPSPSLVIHAGVAKRLSIDLPWDVQLDARIVGDHAPEAAAMTLARSMRESIQANLRLQAERQSTDAASHRVDLARSRFLPQVEASASGRIVNEDLASASLGSQPEEMLTSAITVRQVLFSEPAFAAFSVERRMQAMREFERRAVRLDAAEQAADAYLGVLQAEAAVEIQRENVRVVRANLQAARSRRRAGKAGPQEVSRLETQLARAEQGLLRALGRARRADVGYNRVLNRPLDAPVQLDRPTGVDPRPVLAQFPYASLVDDPGRRASFRRFWVQEARTRAPEVRAVERLVGARERQLASARRSFWMPTVSLEGSLSNRLYEGGIGSAGAELNLPGGRMSLPTPPDQQWSVGLSLRFPLFQGTERAARQRQAQDQLATSRTRRMIAELGVEQSVRNALIDLETSHAAVERALRAADAAQQTLDAVQSAYREGTATLVDLIDAQTAALTTRQEASDAAYGLIRDWMAVQRAAGSFRVLRTPEAQAAFESRLNAALPRESK